MTIELRNYQTDLINKLYESWKTKNRALLQCPTGGGKTAIAMEVIKQIQRCNPDSVIRFIVHRKELCRQVSDVMHEEGIEHSFIASEYETQPAKVYICMVQTLAKRADMYSDLDIIDECHHATSKSYEHIFTNNRKILGLTATPRRLDGKSLNDHFDVLIQGPTIKQLILNGYLAKPQIYVPAKTAQLVADHQGEWKVTAGDYNKQSINQFYADNQKVIYGDVVEHYSRLAKPNSKAIIFCASVAQAYELQELFTDSAVLEGNMNSDERKEVIDKYTAGNIRTIITVDLVSEGFNIPDCDIAILLRITKSLTVFLQQIGRVLRITQDKHTCMIIDHANNCERFGPPWIDRNWTLDGYNVRSKNDPLTGINLKLCMKCNNYVPTKAIICPHCGNLFSNKSKAIKRILEDLQCITIESAEQYISHQIDRIISRERWKMLKTKEDFVQFAESKGWANPEGWAEKKLAEKKVNDDIFFNGTKEQLIVMFSKRKDISDPIKKAEETLARRADLQKQKQNDGVLAVYDSGNLEDIIDYVTKHKPNIENPEAYARGVLKKRLAPVFENGTDEQKAEAQAVLSASGLKVLGTTNNSVTTSTYQDQDRYEKMVKFAQSGKLTPRDEPSPRVLTDEEADKFAKAVVKKDNRTVLDTGDKVAIIDVARQMHIPEERRAAFADAVLNSRGV